MVFNNEDDPKCTVITLSGRNETALLMQVCGRNRAGRRAGRVMWACGVHGCGMHMQEKLGLPLCRLGNVEEQGGKRGRSRVPLGRAGRRDGQTSVLEPGCGAGG